MRTYLPKGTPVEELNWLDEDIAFYFERHGWTLEFQSPSMKQWEKWQSDYIKMTVLLFKEPIVSTDPEGNETVSDCELFFTIDGQMYERQLSWTLEQVQDLDQVLTG